jgi:hypothetical protein
MITALMLAYSFVAWTMFSSACALLLALAIRSGRLRFAVSGGRMSSELIVLDASTGARLNGLASPELAKLAHSDRTVLAREMLGVWNAVPDSPRSRALLDGLHMVCVTERVTPAPGPDWRIAARHDLGDGWWALTLMCEGDDATAVVRWGQRGRGDDVLVVERCANDSAREWLYTVNGEHAAHEATVFGRTA